MRIVISAINDKGYMVDKKGNNILRDKNGTPVVDKWGKETYTDEKPEIAYNIMDAVEIVKTMLSSGDIDFISIYKNNKIRDPKIKEEKLGVE